MGALSLGVQEGSRILIGAKILDVVEVLDNGLTVHVEVDGRQYFITDQERTEVLPGVHVFCGVSAHTPWDAPLRSKLAFIAPREILINRVRTPVAA